MLSLASLYISVISSSAWQLISHLPLNKPLFVFSLQDDSVHLKAARRRSAPVTGNEIFATKKHSEGYEKRALGSKKRIQETKKKYNLKDRDYLARAYVWNEEDEKQIQREREERRKFRQEIRNKYNLPKPSHHRMTKAASG